MPTRQVNWLRESKHFDFTGLTESQIKAKKDQIKAKALVKINRKLRSLRRFRLKSIKWTKERSRPFYYLLVYLTPPAKFSPLADGGGGAGSKITPTPPTVP